MKIPLAPRHIAGLLVAAVLLCGAGLLVWRETSAPSIPHVQVVVASDGAVMVAGVPGRSMRARIQDGRFWNGSSATAPALVDFLRGARLAEGRMGTFDGRALVVVDDHASFQIAKMLIASARTSYSEVTYIDGPVSELPPRHGVDQARPPAAYIKDCSTRPTPAECRAPPPVGGAQRKVQ